MEKIHFKRSQLINIVSIIGLIATVILILIAYRTGILTSSEKLAKFTKSIGILGVIFFVFLQIVQVVFPIIPGGLTCVGGIILFGPLWGFIYNYVGIVIGSIINFALARYYGTKFIAHFASKKSYDKYINWVEKGKHFDKFFALAIFFPVAPDDFLCMLAGLTKMTYKKFMTIIVLGKPAALLIYSLGLTNVVDLIIR